jgi:hypothetical protein
MARKLKESGRKSYNSPPKQCPHPADFRGFPELQAYVNAEYRYRMEFCRHWKKISKN